MSKYCQLIIILVLTHLVSSAQVGIGTNSPTGSAKLDISASDKGVLIPRVALTALNAQSPIVGTMAASLLVYNTASVNGLTPGFYYWSGSAWIRLSVTNEVVNSIGAISNTSDTKGASISSGVLSLTPADATNGGIVTTGDQTFAGNKTFNNNISVNSLSIGAPTSGSQNTMFGNASFGYGSPGNNNTALGFFTLSTLNVGEDNTAVGTNAIRQGGAANGSRNTAVGSAALINGAASSDNVAIGVSTLSNATGGANTAVGTYALQNTTTARENVGLGFYSLHNATEGGYNTAIGSSSMFLNSTGDVNTAVGYKSLYSNQNGRYNTSIGVQSQESNTSGSQNTAIGVAAIDQNTTGSNNAVLGAFAGRHFGANYRFNVDKTTAINNSVLIGYDARPLANDANNEIVIGYNAVGNGSNTVQLGNTSITAVNTSGTITANGFVKSGGASSEFLMANGTATSSPSLSGATSLPLTTGVTGTLPVANGGTGATTLTGLVKGNGTGAMTAAVAGTDYLQAIAPGNSGNVLTSNGTTWVSDKSGSNSIICKIADAPTTILSIGGYQFRYSSTTNGGFIEVRSTSGFDLMMVFCQKNTGSWDLNGATSTQNYRNTITVNSTWNPVMHLWNGTAWNNRVTLSTYESFEATLFSSEGNSTIPNPLKSYKIFAAIDGYGQVFIKAEYMIN